MKFKTIARLTGVEAGHIRCETPLTRIKGLVPEGDAIPRNGRKARLYKVTVAGGKPRAEALPDLGAYVAVPVAARRAFEAGGIREGEALVYVPGEEAGEQVLGFRATRELLEIGERADPGKREVEVLEETKKDPMAGFREAFAAAGPEDERPQDGQTEPEGDGPPSPVFARRRRGRRRTDGPGEEA